MWDVLPWYFWGVSEDDPTSIWDKIGVTVDEGMRQMKKDIKKKYDNASTGAARFRDDVSGLIRRTFD